MSKARQPDRLLPISLPEVPVADSVMRAAPSLVRYGAETWWRWTAWTAGLALYTASRVARAAATGESSSQLVDEITTELRQYAQQLLGIGDIEARLWRLVAPEAGSLGLTTNGNPDGTAAALRARGAELMRRSADVTYVEDTHPAYARILGELAPDEARILRLLALDGPQPSVDVRTSRPLNLGSQLVEPGISMIGVEAGCRRPERVPAYFNNLYRLGLVWFSREPIGDNQAYQVLEVQPEVVAAKRKAGGGRTVRRSIHLTPFGRDFCDMCLPLSASVVEESAGKTEA